jgi:hypothetical protein
MSQRQQARDEEHHEVVEGVQIEAERQECVAGHLHQQVALEDGRMALADSVHVDLMVQERVQRVLEPPHLATVGSCPV